MKKSLTVLLLVIVGTFLCRNALALETYIPHITGGDATWADYLQVNNNTPSAASYTLALYNNGNQIYSQVLSVGGLSRSQIELKALNPNAETGIITYTEPGLVFRVSYKSMGGGVAEFKTIDALNSNIGLCFSDFVTFVEWKGAAIANMGTTSAEVTLYAIGGSVQGSGGTILGTHTESIGPKRKIARLHSAWFSSVGLSQIESIVAVTGSPSLCGIAIASDNAQSRLLFTPAVPVANFNATNCNAADINGRWTIDGKSTGNGGLYITQTCNTFSFYIIDPNDPRERMGTGSINGSTFNLSWDEPYYSNRNTVTNGTATGNTMTGSGISSDGTTWTFNYTRVSGGCSDTIGNWAGTLIGNNVCGIPYTGNWTMTVNSNCVATMSITYSSGNPGHPSFPVVGSSASVSGTCTGCTGVSGILNFSALFSGNIFTGNYTGCGSVDNYTGARQ